MVVGYRRMSGKINLTESEKGTRGSWWEKRRAFFRALKERGHEVEILEGPTPRVFDVLFVEFGSRNLLYHADALQTTAQILSLGHQHVVYLCDDPDLPLSWETLHPASRPKIWANALGPVDLGQPKQVKVLDFPFSSLQEHQFPLNTPQGKFVYLGRPNGRKRQLIGVLDAVRLQVHSKEKDWKGWNIPIQEPPCQVLRSDFYRKELACLGLADSKHHRMGWRTGRIFHAVMAGCPPIVEYKHEFLRRAYPFDSYYRHPSEIPCLLAKLRDPGFRTEIVKKWQERVLMERGICEKRFKEVGL